MDMDMDGKFHIHGNPGLSVRLSQNGVLSKCLNILKTQTTIYDSPVTPDSDI